MVKKKFSGGLFILIVCFILIFALAFFYRSIKKEAPTIFLEEEEACPEDLSLALRKGFYIDYKNSSFRVDVCEFFTKEQATQYFSSELLPFLEKTEKMSVSLDGFSGYKYNDNEHTGLVLQKNEILLFCTSRLTLPLSIFKSEGLGKVESVCKWFIEGYMK